MSFIMCCLATLLGIDPILRLIGEEITGSEVRHEARRAHWKETFIKILRIVDIHGAKTHKNQTPLACLPQ